MLDVFTGDVGSFKIPAYGLNSFSLSFLFQFIFTMKPVGSATCAVGLLSLLYVGVGLSTGHGLCNSYNWFGLQHQVEMDGLWPGASGPGLGPPLWEVLIILNYPPLGSCLPGCLQCYEGVFGACRGHARQKRF